jgi:hypothetical protein
MQADPLVDKAVTPTNGVTTHWLGGRYANHPTEWPAREAAQRQNKPGEQARRNQETKPTTCGIAVTSAIHKFIVVTFYIERTLHYCKYS